MNSLFSLLSYVESECNEPLAAVFKIGSEISRAVLDKLKRFQPLQRCHAKRSASSIYYHSGGRYFRKCMKRKLSNEYKELRLQKEAADPLLCLLSSSLYYWLWIMFSDCYHVTRPDVDMVYVPDSLILDRRFHTLSASLIDDLEKNSKVRIRTREDGSKRKEVNYFAGKSKHLLDEIDRGLADHYGLTAEELDFIINYDIKYRSA